LALDLAAHFLLSLEDEGINVPNSVNLCSFFKSFDHFNLKALKIASKESIRDKDFTKENEEHYEATFTLNLEPFWDAVLHGESRYSLLITFTNVFKCFFFFDIAQILTLLISLLSHPSLSGEEMRSIVEDAAKAYDVGPGGRARTPDESYQELMEVLYDYHELMGVNLEGNIGLA